MKLRGSQWMLVGVAAAVLVWLALELLPGEERRIRSRLAELERQVEKEAGESNLVGAAKVKGIGDLLTREFEIAITTHGQTVTDRGELMRVAMAYRLRGETIEVDFRDVRIEVEASSRSATLLAVAVLSGRRGQSLERESYRVAFDWLKEDGDWKVRRIEVLEVSGGIPPVF